MSKRVFQPAFGVVLGILSLAAFGSPASAASETNKPPHFQEMFRLLRANLEGVSEEDLNRAAVQGLLQQFHPRVMLLNESSDRAESNEGQVDKTTVHDKWYGYLRVARVGPGLAEDIAGAWEKLSATNRLKGLILDLRFAGGHDYAAAASAANRFLTREKPLLAWGDSSIRSTAKEEAITTPLTALINQQTGGAAEALAAVLRDAGAALLIGAKTAGAAHVFKDFTLSNGQQLRIATGSVIVGDGHELSPGGVAPDIEVNVNAEDEKVYFADAFKVLAPATVSRATNLTPSGSTNRPRRINEAELVRRRREGLDLEEAEESANREESERTEPMVRDPALARALDLLKGIAIVEQSRRP
jgi:hypothetical protein